MEKPPDWQEAFLNVLGAESYSCFLLATPERQSTGSEHRSELLLSTKVSACRISPQPREEYGMAAMKVSRDHAAE